MPLSTQTQEKKCPENSLIKNIAQLEWEDLDRFFQQANQKKRKARITKSKKYE